MDSFNTTITKVVTIFSQFRTEPLDFFVEKVTAYAFGVAAKWQGDGFMSRSRIWISYELNQGNPTSICEQDGNSTHVFYNIPTMRPKTMFKVRFRLCFMPWLFVDFCTDFSIYQTVWTKPAGKVSSIQEK